MSVDQGRRLAGRAGRPSPDAARERYDRATADVDPPLALVDLGAFDRNAADMTRRHYALVPRFILRLSLDNLAAITQVRCPILLFHGTADRLVPTAMGMRVAAAAPGPVEVVLIQNAGHNDTYDAGGDQYRDKLWAFIGAGN